MTPAPNFTGLGHSQIQHFINNLDEFNICRCFPKLDPASARLAPIRLLKIGSFQGVIILCTGKKSEQIELLELDKSGIHVAEYLTTLPQRVRICRPSSARRRQQNVDPGLRTFRRCLIGTAGIT